MIRRRTFIAGLGAAAWPIAVRAQRSSLLVIAFIHAGSADTLTHLVVAFRAGLTETGFVEGRNVTVEYHWLDGRYDRVPALVADLVRRRVAVIVATDAVAPTAKAATVTIPVVFLVVENPVELGLVASLAQPGGNLTGINSLSQEVLTKQLALLHHLLPRAARVAVLVNPNSPANAAATLRQVEEVAQTLSLQIQIVEASTSREIDAVFASFAHERPDALLQASDAFFGSRSAQLITLTARDRIPAVYSDRSTVVAGGLMSYGASFTDMFRQIGVYTGRILNGTKPADLPVAQPTRFEFVINMQTARAFNIAVPPTLLAIADEVIE